MSVRVEHADGTSFLNRVKDDSVDLVLTDPPYIISKSTGMNTHFNRVKSSEAASEWMKTEDEWLKYKSVSGIQDDANKLNYMKFGSIYGKKYCVQTDYGTWDSEFTMEALDRFVASYYQKLRKGGTLIMFFDVWKLESLKSIFEKHKFKQIRLIEWIKTNPQPLNSSVNYLTNCREVALVGVKGSNPTFNSKMDNGVYMFPLQGGKHRIHPTQKSVRLFERLIEKHSNEGDMVLDTFLGGGTTAIACLNTRRRFEGCEINKTYFDLVEKMIQKLLDDRKDSFA
jgi:site-specific DNA-methyltransferase (adenine-specific)